MKTVRDLMVDSDSNLEWCRPVSFLSGRVVIVVNSGRIDGIQVDGEEWKVTAENITAMINLVFSGYDIDRSLYSGYSDTDILLSGECDGDLACHECPWFDVCQAMDEEVEEPEEYEEDEAE